MFTVLIAFYGLEHFPSHQLRMYGGRQASAVTLGQGTSLSFLSPPLSVIHPACCPHCPCGFGQESMQKTCSEPSINGPWGWGGDRALTSCLWQCVVSHSGMGRIPVQELCMAVHCMCCPLTWLTPWVALPMYWYHPIALAKLRPSDDLPTNWPQQAAACSTDQTNSSLTTREGFQQTTTSHSSFPSNLHTSLLSSTRMTPCPHRPSTVLPHKTVTSQMSLSLGLDLRPGLWREKPQLNSSSPTGLASPP